MTVNFPASSRTPPVWINEPTEIDAAMFNVPELMANALPRLVSVPEMFAVPPLTMVVPLTS